MYKFERGDSIKFQDTLDNQKALEALGWELEGVNKDLNERDLLKQEADELGIEYPKNIKTDKLVELIKEAKE